MPNIEKSGRLPWQAFAGALLCLAASANATAEDSLLPALKSVAIEVDISSLPASEQATLVPILRAARLLDDIYVRQVWPGTRALINERRSVIKSSAAAELDALNFFKGPWGPNGKPFIGGVPPLHPITLSAGTI